MTVPSTIITIRRGARVLYRGPLPGWSPEVEATAAFARSPAMRVPWYLILSHLYYERDESIVSDAFFDRLCVDLLRDLDKIEHRHKHLVDPDALRAGTGHHLAGRYPEIVKSAAMRLLSVDSLRRRW